MLSRALSKIYQIYRLKILKKGLSAGIAAGRSRRITNDIIPSAVQTPAILQQGTADNAYLCPCGSDNLFCLGHSRRQCDA